MSTDRELLELAAKACGIGPVIGFAVEACELMIGPRNHIRYWRPLTDDGDALRLAVRLDLHVQCDFKEEQSKVYIYGGWVGNGIEEEPGELDKFGATRRAIVRAAAEIGRSMP